ncbi:phosphoglycerate mutase-like protein [Pleomassaria siparia CBS 279.74]|uniref:Phosphoglycerate mutase-like protein n=1 Tax=Pleomassaria siparia CBS 279.74 TaxID=1314801 RepID=A0A6G1K1V7_9PLEO|nr:phosphoglycerate mutase-like protein [Pleomassaria siparia CBS 279.74]
MLALFVAVMAAVWLIDAANDQSAITVHGSVVLVRSGETTPVLQGDRLITALGAQQMFKLGQNLRSRYINEDGPTGLGVQKINNVEPYRIDNNQILVQTLDEPYLIASAQALMQALYPPYSIDRTRNGPDADGIYILANGSEVDFPLNGYQYAEINTLGAFDAQSAYLGGNQQCPSSASDQTKYDATSSFQQTKDLHQDFYQAIDLDMFHGLIPQRALNYGNAYELYDYLSYSFVHDRDVYEKLNNESSNPDVLDQLRYLADEEAWYHYGNTTETDANLRAMGGKTLAALVLGSFQHLIDNKGNTTNGSAHSLSLLFPEHEPLISLFSLLGLDHDGSSPMFHSIPPPGSALVFELFSVGTDEFPNDSKDLSVQFYYQNGSSFDGSLRPYPIFNHGPSVSVLSWVDYQDEMSKIMVSDLGDWCATCQSPALFCWGVDESSISVIVSNTKGQRHKISPTVAGVIGAVVTLFVAGLLFALAMLVGGIRLHRVKRNANSDLGGFKGSTKLASDADLSIAKNATPPAGATIMGFGGKDAGPGRKAPHERVGSWELRQKEFGSTGNIDDESRKSSFEAIEAALEGPGGGVQPHERV